MHRRTNRTATMINKRRPQNRRRGKGCRGGHEGKIGARRLNHSLHATGPGVAHLTPEIHTFMDSDNERTHNALPRRGIQPPTPVKLCAAFAAYGGDRDHAMAAYAIQTNGPWQRDKRQTGTRIGRTVPRNEKSSSQCFGTIT